MPTITAEQRAKGQASKLAAKAARQEQTIIINDNWRILRADDFNWQLEQRKKVKDSEPPRYEWNFIGFYSSLENAFRSIPAKLLDEVARKDLATVLESLASIKETVEKAIVRAKFVA